MGLFHALLPSDLVVPSFPPPPPPPLDPRQFPSFPSPPAPSFRTPSSWSLRVKSVIACSSSGCPAWPCPCLAGPVLAEERRRNCDLNLSRPCIQSQAPSPAAPREPHSKVEDGHGKFGSSQRMLGSEEATSYPSSVNVPCTSWARLYRRHGGSSTKQMGQGLSMEADEGPVVLEERDELWLKMRTEARRDAEREPVLASYLYSSILAHRSLERALAFHLGNKLCSATLLSTQLYTLIVDTLMEETDVREAVRADMEAVRERDPACKSYAQCMLNFKGFLACQAYRVAHSVWLHGRHSLSLALQSRISEVFMVDIHPAALIGKGILFDHATGVVIGETTVVGDHVSILHKVTLGGSGLFGGDRHPKIGDGVLIGAGATILGNICIGHGAKIGAGSVVLTSVPPGATAVGNPARLVKGKALAPSSNLPAITMDHTSFIDHWSDYVI